MAERLVERSVEGASSRPARPPSKADAAAGWPRILWSAGDNSAGDLALAGRLGFSAVLLPGDAYVQDPGLLAGLPLGQKGTRRSAPRDLGPSVDILLRIEIGHLDIAHPLVSEIATDFSLRRASGTVPVDPRKPGAPAGRASVRHVSPALLSWWEGFAARCAEAGIGGFSIPIENELTCALASGLRSKAPGLFIVAETRNCPDRLLGALSAAGFSHTTSSLPWWDGRAIWLMTERERLLAAAPPLAVAALPDYLPTDMGVRRSRLVAAAIAGAGWIMPAGFEAGLEEDVKWLNGHFRTAGRAMLKGLRVLPNDAGLLLVRHEGTGLLAAFNTAPSNTAPTNTAPSNTAPTNNTAPGDLSRRLGNVPGLAAAMAPALATGNDLRPGEAALFHASDPEAPGRQPPPDALNVATATAARLVIDRIDPSVDAGRYPVKRLAGERLTVSANIFMDGHALLAARLCVKLLGEKSWRSHPMTHLGNDRWAGETVLGTVGAHVFRIEAWFDDWGTYRRDLEKKIAAKTVVEADLHDAAEIIEGHAARHRAARRKPFDNLLQTLRTAEQDELIALLLSPATDDIMAASDHRPFLAHSFSQQVRAERIGAQFASWYELFPRSLTDDPARHGTFRDVIDRLPAIRAMGFDTLYFPPVHPIGRINRKGANNSLEAAADEPGSPYAIGGEAGGHDALHPQLGSFDDFRDLVEAARDQGIEIALDFAIQCAPDHPWLRANPEWFAWRSDGTVRYAENPPKKYQDIVNVDFYRDGAIPNLWLALRDIVLFWVWHGVKCFRVDNPHTKPLPFWHWLIEEVTTRHPDVVFLSEAFTRPAPMYHLAKVGFSQSYTYFTWRNTKQELTDYFTELATTEVKEFFRPHLFVNTPDINPFFLQQSGRAGFLIRACLGATLSGLFGIYSGFELCEAAPLPGKEEYLDSEKYQIRTRDWQQPGNIIAELTALNRLRRYEPALQTHLNTVFYNAFNDRILYYGKRLAGHAEMILIAVNLDPHDTQAAEIELPLWEFGLPDSGSFEVEDLLGGARFAWQGKVQRITLSPHAPYAIWRVRPRQEA